MSDRCWQRMGLWIQCGAVLFLFLALFQSTASADLLLKNLTLITCDAGRNTVSAKNGYLWIVAGKIHYVGSQRPKVPTTTAEFDGEGGFLLPGPIDSHVHLGQAPGIHLRDQERKKRLINVWQALRYGFTSLIDLGEFNHDYVRKFYSMRE